MERFEISIEAFKESQGFVCYVTITTPLGTTQADQKVIVTRVMGRISKLGDAASGYTRQEFTDGCQSTQMSEQVIQLACFYVNPDFPGKVSDSLASIQKIDTVGEPKLN